ncbi:MAG: GntR family transcriptional regulator [Syntrophaceae bacterium]|nr:GntR family transcriptional regulator [Syntrophaceae bacterium]
MAGTKRERPKVSNKTDGNRTQMAYRKIKEMMFNYDIVPGQRLIFVDFANRLGVSRTPINNALSILANEGFLDFIPNQGYRVHEITREEANHLYEIREIIELGAIELAIKKVSPEKLKTLETQKKLYEKSVMQQVTRGRFTLDQEFHACYVQMAENPYLTDYFREVYQRIFLRHRIEGLPVGRSREVVIEHKEIFKAISMKDVGAAQKLIKQHIRAGKDYIFSAIFGQKSI